MLCTGVNCKVHIQPLLIKHIPGLFYLTDIFNEAFVFYDLVIRYHCWCTCLFFFFFKKGTYFKFQNFGQDSHP